MHSGVNDKRLYNDSWSESIPTVLHFSDFFTYILEEEYSWLEEQDKIYDEQIEIERQQLMEENLARQIELEMGSQLDINVGNLSFTDDDLILKDSIKDMIRKKTWMEMEINDKEKKIENKKSSISDKPFKNKEKNSQKNIKETPKETIFGLEIAADDEPFYKIGFDIDSKRIQMNGNFFEYYSPDGCKVFILLLLIYRFSQNHRHTLINFVRD